MNDDQLIRSLMNPDNEETRQETDHGDKTDE